MGSVTANSASVCAFYKPSTAPRRAQGFDAGFEGGDQFGLVAGDDRDRHHADRPQNQGVFGKILAFVLAHKTDQCLKHVRLSFQKEIGWQSVCQPEIYRKARGGLGAVSLRGVNLIAQI